MNIKRVCLYNIILFIGFDADLHAMEKDNGDAQQIFFQVIDCGNIRLARELMRDERVRINMGDEHGDTALHKAAKRGSSRMVHLLLAKHADPNIKNNDLTTPIYSVVWCDERSKQLGIHGHNPRRVQIIRSLVEHGAHLYDNDNGGNTVLDAIMASKYVKSYGVIDFDACRNNRKKIPDIWWAARYFAMLGVPIHDLEQGHPRQQEITTHLLRAVLHADTIIDGSATPDFHNYSTEEKKIIVARLFFAKKTKILAPLLASELAHRIVMKDVIDELAPEIFLCPDQAVRKQGIDFLLNYYPMRMSAALIDVCLQKMPIEQHKELFNRLFLDKKLPVLIVNGRKLRTLISYKYQYDPIEYRLFGLLRLEISCPHLITPAQREELNRLRTMRPDLLLKVAELIDVLHFAKHSRLKDIGRALNVGLVLAGNNRHGVFPRDVISTILQFYAGKTMPTGRSEHQMIAIKGANHPALVSEKQVIYKNL